MQIGGDIVRRKANQVDSGAEFLMALDLISKERGIDREIIYEAIESSLVAACKKNYGSNQDVKVEINRETGKVQVFAQKTVTEVVTDSDMEITLEQAQNINPRYNLGDVVDVEVTPKNFGRISAQNAKQVVVQKLREAERELLFNEYTSKERDIVTGIVQRWERKNVIVALGKADAVLPANEQIPGEEYSFQDRLKVYVLDVRTTTKGPMINVSRTHPDLVKRLFEQEVPEIYDGIVEIKSISREAGSRTKLAVYSKKPDVDAVGACVGQNGYRVNVIVEELRGEKIDIINWSDDPKEYIAAALSPSKVLAVELIDNDKSAKVVVPDYQLSLAIGKEGQNVRLAAKLTGWRIDIKSQSQAAETGYLKSSDYFDFGEDARYDGEYEEDELYEDEEYEDGEYYDEEESYEDEGEYYEEDEEYYDEDSYEEDEYLEEDSYDDNDEGYNHDAENKDED